MLNRSILVFYFYTIITFPMLTPINCIPLFKACEEGKKEMVEQFIEDNPTYNLENKNEHGETILLYAARLAHHSCSTGKTTVTKWNIVWHLLKKGADRNVQDNHGQTVFSHGFYHYANSPAIASVAFMQNITFYYTPQEINAFCKTMPIHYGFDYSPICMTPLMEKTLQNEIDLSNKELTSNALYVSCRFSQVPLIVQLLQLGADLYAKDGFGENAYSSLMKNKKTLFVVREAFNDGPCIHLINVALEGLVKDIKEHIMSFYIKLLLSSPEAELWKPDAVNACMQDGIWKTTCAKLGITATDPMLCLITILLMPQEMKTTMNIRNYWNKTLNTR